MYIFFFGQCEWGLGGAVELLTAAISPVERLHGVFPDGGEVVGNIGCRFAGVVRGELGLAGIAPCEAGGLGREYLGWVEEAWSVSREGRAE